MTTIPPFRPPNPVVIGVLGGIASGKSTVAKLFGEAGIVRIDADAEARRVSEDPAILERIRRRFGASAFDDAGRLDRKALAAVVFDDDHARSDLESIVHPAVRAAVTVQMEAALADGRSVVLDVPLLMEGGLIDRCDHVVFVESSEEQRIARASGRNWTAAELRRREAAQGSLGVKKARATASIRNSESLVRTRRQVAALLARWLSADSGSA